VDFSVSRPAEGEDASSSEISRKTPGASAGDSSRTLASGSSPDGERLIPGLNPHHTFASFIRGDSNTLALKAAEAAVRNPGKVNPLYIHGESGLGKTHLLHAAVHRFLEQKPEARVLILSLEDFKDSFISALYAKKNIEFRNKNKNYDWLCLEDIRNLNYYKPAVQEEFFYLFNHYYESGRQIIITGDIPVSRLTVSSRLISRIISGLQVSLENPDEKLRVVFLKKRAAALGLRLNPGIVDFIAQRVKHSIRGLESALNKLYFMKSQGYNVNNPEVAAAYLAELIPLDPNRTLSLDLIIRTVSKEFDVSQEMILGSSRKANVTMPRHIAMYLAVKRSGMNKTAIARYFRKNDHSTVINAEKNVKKRMDREPEFRRIVENLSDELNRAEL